MSTMYAILSVAGWVWAVVFFAALGIVAWHRRAGRRSTRGFEVVTDHDNTPRR